MFTTRLFGKALFAAIAAAGVLAPVAGAAPASMAQSGPITRCESAVIRYCTVNWQSQGYDSYQACYEDQMRICDQLRY